MQWTPPTAADFKAFFNRDFNYAPSTNPLDPEYVTDTDINKAILEGEINFNAGMFNVVSGQSTNVFMYLAAFYLVANIQLSERGLSAQANFPIESNTVQGVAINVQIPERFLKNPVISQYAQNGYGMKYLSFVLPQLVGNVGIVGSGQGWNRAWNLR